MNITQAQTTNFPETTFDATDSTVATTTKDEFKDAATVAISPVDMESMTLVRPASMSEEEWDAL